MAGRTGTTGSGDSSHLRAEGFFDAFGRCVINDIADRNFDPYVARTRQRPLAAQRITVREAAGLFIVLCLAPLRWYYC